MNIYYAPSHTFIEVWTILSTVNIKFYWAIILMSVILHLYYFEKVLQNCAEVFKIPQSSRKLITHYEIRLVLAKQFVQI